MADILISKISSEPALGIDPELPMAELDIARAWHPYMNAIEMKACPVMHDDINSLKNIAVMSLSSFANKQLCQRAALIGSTVFGKI